MSGPCAISALSLPVAQYPEIAPPVVTVRAVYPGASAQTVDESVVSLIEEELNGADHLLYFESQSSLGSATIKATFQPGTNPELAQVDVQNRLKVVESRLPQAVNQQGLQVEKVSAGFLLLITLTSSDGKLDDVALSDYLARNVMNQVMDHGKVVRGYLGVLPEQQVADEDAGHGDDQPQHA